MWAMMPMFLQRSNGTVLGTTLLFPGLISSIFDFVILPSGNLVIENQNARRVKLQNYPITKRLNRLTIGNARKPC
jgi:hypothetical protein